jgi:hypothetical protein
MLQSKSPELDDAIEKLADMGFLSRGSSRASTSSTSPISPPHSPDGNQFDRYDREAWREARRAMRQAVHESRHDYHRARHSDEGDSEIVGRTYAEYRQRVIERAHKAAGGFAGHLIPFLAVNGFLFFLNLSTGFGFPWFLFPLGGWAIGLISHFVSVNTHRREKREVEALPEALPPAPQLSQGTRVDAVNDCVVGVGGWLPPHGQPHHFPRFHLGGFSNCWFIDSGYQLGNHLCVETRLIQETPQGALRAKGDHRR